MVSLSTRDTSVIELHSHISTQHGAKGHYFTSLYLFTSILPFLHQLVPATLPSLLITTKSSVSILPSFTRRTRYSFQVSKQRHYNNQHFHTCKTHQKHRNNAYELGRRGRCQGELFLNLSSVFRSLSLLALPVF